MGLSLCSLMTSICIREMKVISAAIKNFETVSVTIRENFFYVFIPTLEG